MVFVEKIIYFLTFGYAKSDFEINQLTVLAGGVIGVIIHWIELRGFLVELKNSLFLGSLRLLTSHYYMNFYS